MPETPIIKALHTDILFGNVSLDAYKLHTYYFEKRIGLTGASKSLGYSKEWLGRLPKHGVKQLQAMQNDGFTGCQIEVSVSRLDGSGASIAKTISIRDFNKLIAYEALKKKNVHAIILLIAFAEAGLERVISNAFDGVPLDWFAEKIVHYTKWTHDELMEVLQYNREDVRSLYLGLPPSLDQRFH